jgi:hypothetical protein
LRAAPQLGADRALAERWTFLIWAALEARKTEQGGVQLPGKSPGPSIKRPQTYEALKKKGMSKSRAARISNAQAKKGR